MIDPEELAICRRRGHNLAMVLDNKWSQCESCGMWVRELVVIQEREDEPSEEKIHPLVISRRRLEEARGERKPREAEVSNAEEFAICKRRGHNFRGLSVGEKWVQCESCGVWVREVRVPEEREGDPPEEDIHPLVVLLRKLNAREKRRK
jgi:hypothetical protein